jgi:nitrate reductase alpha subunit
MSHILDSLLFFKKNTTTSFAEGYGAVTQEDRGWEDGYRKRWQYDKVVRSTHGVNCTGSCGWQVYVKGGFVTWETQVLDYPRTRADLPDHEPRGCARGASASWYLYSSNRIKYPLIRRALMECWREARRVHADPVVAWQSIVEDPETVKRFKGARGKGGFVRAGWAEANELIVAANIYTIKQHGPDRVVGFSPIPAMSMISYAAGTRYLSLLGGTCLSFYDWYCDLPPASPQTWGEQTDVPESADWYNSSFIIVWGSNVPQTRTPDAHYLTEVRYRGTKTVVVTPDYSEASKFADLWLDPKQGTDAAMAMAMGHVILKEFHADRQTPYFQEYCRNNTDLPFLVRLELQGGRLVPTRALRSSDFADNLGQETNAEWKPVALAETADGLAVPRGSIGFRWDVQRPGEWNLDPVDARSGKPTTLGLTLLGCADSEVAEVAFPYFGGRHHEFFEHSGKHDEIQLRQVPARRVQLEEGEVLVASVYDLMLAHYGVDRGLGGVAARSYDDDVPYTPAWQERITGVAKDKVIAVARAFAETAEKTNGRSMVIIGTGVNQWFHNDMTYRAVINMLVLCGTVGQSGGGWAHYVGQEKLRPQPGWQTLAFALDWQRPPRQMNGTSFWYAHTDQWRYERIKSEELRSPLAQATGEPEPALIDYNVRAERMGWLPSSPQLKQNPLSVGRELHGSGADAGDSVATRLSSGALSLACEDPDHPDNFPRNLFVWRSNLLGSSSKGHEYFLKHLVGAKHGVLGEDLKVRGEALPLEVEFRDEAPEGKLDLLVAIDFRMSSTCMYSDIVLPTATWYEKNDLSTTDMHPFIHPLTGAVDPLWECKSDWEIFRGFAERFSELCPGHLGTEHDVVLQPLMHDSASEMGQALAVCDWKRDGQKPIPGRTMSHVALVERDYPATHARFCALGPLVEELGNATKGLTWDGAEEVAELGATNGRAGRDSVAAGRPRLETDLHACEAILTLSPETNGKVAVKAWEALSQRTGRQHKHLAQGRAADRIRFEDVVAQPRKVITSPTWSGVESEEVSYTGSYINLHERVPWRTLTGRQQLFQDHPWMQEFGEQFPSYKPPIDTKSIGALIAEKDNGNPQLILNFLTPHQKWGIHSSFADTQMMLTLSRGGPNVWISEDDARRLGIEDNDWIEAFNSNGALAARAVVSQRIKPGCAFMYHSQDKTVNTPGTESTSTRGIHNSISRIVVKPTHMIGGYAQQSYGFNYYGTVGANRDDFVVIRKVRRLDWMDGTEAKLLPRPNVDRPTAEEVTP